MPRRRADAHGRFEHRDAGGGADQQADEIARAQRLRRALRRLHHERPLRVARNLDQYLATPQHDAAPRRAVIHIDRGIRGEREPAVIGEFDSADRGAAATVIGEPVALQRKARERKLPACSRARKFERRSAINVG